MSIRTRKNKDGSERYLVDYYPGGRKKILTLPDGTSADEAVQIEKYLRGERQITPPHRANLTVAELFGHYLDWYSLHRLPRSYERIKGVFERNLKPEMGQVAVAHLSEAHILAYKKKRAGDNKERAGGKISNRTINLEFTYLSGFLSWCVKNRVIERKPQIEMLPYKRPLPVVLTHEEALGLINAAPPLYRAFFSLLYFCGLRINEVRHLTWKMVDESKGTVRARQKGGAWKILPMTDYVIKTLAVLPRSAGLIFRSKVTDGPIIDIRKALSGAAKSAGITKRVTAHTLRHSIATNMLTEHVNLRVIQSLLGHSRITTTEFYTQTNVEVLRSAQKMLDSNITKANHPQGIGIAK